MGEDLYPTIYEKAACLFLHTAGGHIFENGNKRTGVLTLDQFLHANSIYVFFDDDQMVEIAQRTASYRAQGRTYDQEMQTLVQEIRLNSVSFDNVRRTGIHDLYQDLQNGLLQIRQHPLNRRDQRPRQALMRGK